MVWRLAWRSRRREKPSQAPEGALRIKAGGKAMLPEESDREMGKFCPLFSPNGNGDGDGGLETSMANGRSNKRQNFHCPLCVAMVDRFEGAFKSSFRTDFSQSSTCSQTVWTWLFSPLKGSRAPDPEALLKGAWSVQFNSWTIVSVQWIVAKCLKNFLI